MLKEQAGIIEQQLGVSPIAGHVPSAQTRAAVEATRHSSEQPLARRDREAAAAQLIAGKIDWVYDKYMSKGGVIDSRPDLEDRDLLQMGAVSILEAAQYAETQTDRPPHVHIHEQAPRLMRQGLLDTKLMPEKYGDKSQAKIEPADKAISKKPSTITHVLEPQVDYAADPAEGVPQKVVAQQVAGLLGRLQERQAAVLRMRFGFNGEPEHTLQAVGDRLGITRQAVCLIEREALAELREATEHRGWAEPEH